jgi:hypothetical protein
VVAANEPVTVTGGGEFVDAVVLYSDEDPPRKSYQLRVVLGQMGIDQLRSVVREELVRLRAELREDREPGGKAF